MKNQKRVMPARSPIRARGVMVITAVLSMVMLSGCVPGDGSYSAADPAGFFWAIWHGWVAPISLIIGLFKSDIRVYEIFNTGWAYDLGFYIAIISGFGGLSLRRRKTRDE
ncbi:hypothetical protein MH117_14715 [Paenibacillus sp. ACRRX]|uniref:hypothetical protein n=1 Tax=Paenibacillus sp. ACRRX TaxID=2918206 RepID=UPI001EF66727|nr:hypothetical protein [Paenibacillus sp. ACRRX]MCG7408681.1 hypothetical protein [Paenibacillus sp. ACRRX]